MIEKNEKNKLEETVIDIINTGNIESIGDRVFIPKNKDDNESDIAKATINNINNLTGTDNSSIMQYGWVCPRCGKVNAPWKDSCNCYLNIPYTPPNTPTPTPFNPAPSWPQVPEVGDAPGWWQYGPRCGDPIPCDRSVGSDSAVPKLQIYNTALTNTANTDSPDITAIKSMSEVVNDSLSTPLNGLKSHIENKLN